MSRESAERLAPSYVLEGDSDPWADWRKTAVLVKHLTRRNLAVRYRGSTLGFFWSLLSPIVMMCVYTFVFQFVLRLASPGVPFPVFFLTGVLAWNFLQVATLNSATSILDNLQMLDKVYFPRITLPLAAALASSVNYAVTIPILLVFNLFFGIYPGVQILLLPLAFLFVLALSVALGLIVASLVPFFRDLVQFLELAFLAWFFATPVLYPIEMARENLSPLVFTLYQMNPAAGAMVLTRAVFLQESVSPASIALPTLTTLVLLGVGLKVFLHLQTRFSTAG